MCYFRKFDRVYSRHFNEDFAAISSSAAVFDRLNDLPAGIRELDRRPVQPPVYVDLPEEPVTETIPMHAFEINVVGLATEMEESTEPSNPVEPVSAIETMDTLMSVTKRTVSTSRGAVIQTSTGEKAIATPTFIGSRKDRRAAKAIFRKQHKRGNGSNGLSGNHAKDRGQKTGLPRVLNLSDLPFGFRLE